MNNKSYSHVDNKNIPFDKKLDELFACKKNGVYIELGAADGLTQSNTAFFEFCRNWSGVLIEPSVKSYELCVKNRPNNTVLNFCCVSNSYEEDTIKGDFNSTNLMNSVNGERLNSNELIEVNCITLEKVFDLYLKNKKVDLLSLDAEGYEYNILEGLNLDKNRPCFLLVEIYNKDYQKLLNYLIGKGYRLHSSFSNYNKIDNPFWDGTHNDYLFCDNNTQS